MPGGFRLGAGRYKTRKPNKTEVLQIRVTAEEAESVRETATHYGMKVSDLIRVALGLSEPKA